MILGYVKHKQENSVFPYVDKDENGYLILVFGEEKRWSNGQWWDEVEEPKEEESLFIPRNEFEKSIFNVCVELAETLIRKNRDYGDSFKKIYDEYGDLSTLIRLTDKLERFKTLQSQDNLVKDESKDDTLLDIMGYSCLTLALKRGRSNGEK